MLGLKRVRKTEKKYSRKHLVDFGVFFTHTAVRSLEPNNEEVKPMSTKQVNMGFCVQDLFRFNFS